MELRTYLRILRAHWIGVVLLTVLGVVTAFGWSLLQPRVYTADAGSYVSAVRASGSSDAGSALVAENLSKAKVKSFLDLGTWRSVAERAIEDLGIEASPESLVRRVKVTNPVDTVNIKVSASASTPEGARDLAEAWVRAMAAEIEDLETNGGAAEPTVQLVPGDSAELPTAPSSPNTRLALALGGLIGLALGIGYAVLRYVLDRRIRSADAVERETGVAVVGLIPEEKTFTPEDRLLPIDPTSSGQSAKLFAVSEAMRELRTNIRFMDVDNPPRVIVVSSPLPGDGKSTTSSNLAITLAANGEKVVLIDGDLRRPMIAKIFRLVGGVGLTDVLAERATFADIAQTVDSAGNLLVVGAGKLPPNPSEVLGSARMRALIRDLAQTHTVIIDAPPLLPVTDAAVLGHSADGVVVVASVGKTTFDALGKALQNLERAGARALGVVLNRVPRKRGGAGYYDYRYGGDYYYRSADSETMDEIDVSAAPEASASEVRAEELTGTAAASGPSTTTAPAGAASEAPSRRSRRRD